jgi:hypothetical protein
MAIFNDSSILLSPETASEQTDQTKDRGEIFPDGGYPCNISNSQMVVNEKLSVVSLSG